MIQDFNPRSREGSDDSPNVPLCLPSNISIHAPAKGATHAGLCSADKPPVFQSTLPRRERRSFSAISARSSPISIHAPAKGATGRDHCMMVGHFHFNPRSREGSDLNAFNGQAYGSISIHAPAKGATGKQSDSSHTSNKFQSTLPRRERRTPITHAITAIAISIHAPAKGATVGSVF